MVIVLRLPQQDNLAGNAGCIQLYPSFHRPATLPVGYTGRVRYEQDEENCGFAEARTLAYVTRQNVRFDNVLRRIEAVPRNCGEGLQIGTKHAVLPDRRVQTVRN